MPCGAGEFFGELTELRLLTPDEGRALVAHPSPSISCLSSQPEWLYLRPRSPLVDGFRVERTESLVTQHTLSFTHTTAMLLGYWNTSFLTRKCNINSGEQFTRQSPGEDHSRGRSSRGLNPNLSVD